MSSLRDFTRKNSRVIIGKENIKVLIVNFTDIFKPLNHLIMSPPVVECGAKSDRVNIRKDKNLKLKALMIEGKQKWLPRKLLMEEHTLKLKDGFNSRKVKELTTQPGSCFESAWVRIYIILQ